MNVLQAAQDLFFDEGFWLADNVTWSEYQNRPGDGFYIPQPVDLWKMFPAALGLFVVRAAVEKFLATPLGRYYGISERRVSATPNHSLEQVYKESPYPAQKSVEALSKQTDLSEKQIQRWFRRRRNQDRPTDMTKLTETAWRCFFYMTMFLYGLFVVARKSYFWDVKDCWRGHPRQHVEPEVFWYYIVELGFYVSLLFSQFTDVKRKDFWEQFIHHIATILLLSFSWIANFVRVGALILCLHDAADYLLEGAKLARYIEKRTLCDVLFGLFTLCWAVTRLTIFPYIILWTTYVDSRAIAGPTPAITLLNTLLWVLQVLHVFWFVLIMNVVINSLKYGKVEKDVRSASEESGDEVSVSTNGSSHLSHSS